MRLQAGLDDESRLATSLAKSLADRGIQQADLTVEVKGGRCSHAVVSGKPDMQTPETTSNASAETSDCPVCAAKASS
eukprot:7503353-Pyramimonas_sp.AAC.1